MRVLVPNLIIDKLSSLDVEELRKHQIRGLIIDIDNTIVPWGEIEIQADLKSWLEFIKSEGFSVCLVSNALKTRTDELGVLLKVPVVGRAMKPMKKAFFKGLQMLDLSPKEVAVIGDQLFTDILGANRLNLFSILVNPLSTNELGITKLVRRIERRILRYLVKKELISAEELQIRTRG